MVGRGAFVVLEGAADSGKSSTAKALKQRLDRMHVPSIVVRELSGGPIVTLARGYAQNGSHAHSLACLVCADRYRLLTDMVEPALASGTTVVLERYIPSTLVYQGMQGLGTSFLLALNKHAPIPDLTAHLLAPAHQIKVRRRAARSRDAFQENAHINVELAFYREAMRCLRLRNWPIVRFNTAKRSITQIADALATRIVRLQTARARSNVAQ